MRRARRSTEKRVSRGAPAAMGGTSQAPRALQRHLRSRPGAWGMPPSQDCSGTLHMLKRAVRGPRGEPGSEWGRPTGRVGLRSRDKLPLPAGASLPSCKAWLSQGRAQGEMGEAAAVLSLRKARAHCFGKWGTGGRPLRRETPWFTLGVVFSNHRDGTGACEEGWGAARGRAGLAPPGSRFGPQNYKEEREGRKVGARRGRAHEFIMSLKKKRVAMF